jgi:hypothetical protein
MRFETIQFGSEILHKLRVALVDTDDLRRALVASATEPVASQPGYLRARPTLAVPRALDPETAEVRQLDVVLRPVDGGGMEVVAVRGLDLEGIGEG